MKSQWKLYILIIGVFICLLFVSYFVTESTMESKEEKNYIQEEENSTYEKCPQITLKGNDIKSINGKIKELCKYVPNSSDFDFDYDSSNGSDIFSFIGLNSYYEPDASIKTYNMEIFNIDKESGEQISDEQLYERYNIDPKIVSQVIENTMQVYYEDEIKQGYLNENQCDYNCFLQVRGIDKNNYAENAKLYIGEDTVFAYKTFNIISSYADEGYYGQPIEAFRFFIK